RFEAAMEALRVPHDATMVVGVSGGPDSIALLNLLLELNTAGWRLRPHVAHLDHMIRGHQSAEDARFVSELAQTLRIPATVDTLDVSTKAATEKISLELAGRVARFEFFQRVCLRSGAELVALAHHADDQSETVL